MIWERETDRQKQREGGTEREKETDRGRHRENRLEHLSKIPGGMLGNAKFLFLAFNALPRFLNGHKVRKQMSTATVLYNQWGPGGTSDTLQPPMQY